MRSPFYPLAFLAVPLLSVMVSRGLRPTRPPIEVFADMEKQAKYKPQAESNFFADGRADRPIPAGTVPYARVTQLPMPDGTVRYADPDFLRADDFHYDGDRKSVV